VGAKQIDVAWNLIYSNLIQDPNHGFGAECNAPDGGVVMQLRFVVTNQNTKASATTTAPCPAAAQRGAPPSTCPTPTGRSRILGQRRGKADGGDDVKDVTPNASVTGPGRSTVAGCPMGSSS